MKRLITYLMTLIFMLMVVPCFAATNLTSGDQTIYGTKTFEHGVVLQGTSTIEGVLIGYGITQWGDIYYVDSTGGVDSTGNYGTKYTTPFATVDYAINQCTANHGDIIVVMNGHAESYTAANGFDADVAGITIIGMGSGTDMPEFTFPILTQQ